MFQKLVNDRKGKKYVSVWLATARYIKSFTVDEVCE